MTRNAFLTLVRRYREVGMVKKLDFSDQVRHLAVRMAENDILTDPGHADLHLQKWTEIASREFGKDLSV